MSKIIALSITLHIPRSLHCPSHCSLHCTLHSILKVKQEGPIYTTIGTPATRNISKISPEIFFGRGQKNRMDGTKDDNRKSEDIQEDGEGGGGSRDGDVQKITPSKARDSKEIGAGEGKLELSSGDIYVTVSNQNIQEKDDETRNRGAGMQYSKEWYM